MSLAGQRRSDPQAVVWHELECGSYSADLPLWQRLADEAPGDVLDLGCGIGRVSLHLARRGHSVVAIDSDPVLIAELERRAGDAGLPLSAVLADARDFDLGRSFGLVLAPMQLLQLFADDRERRSCLANAERHLAPGALMAAAILAPGPGAGEAEDAPPLPDLCEQDGWVFSSLPLAVLGDGSRISIRRLRQTVSPEGALSEDEHEVSIAELPAATLEAEAEAVGLRSAGRRAIAATEDHVGSTVVLLEAG